MRGSIGNDVKIFRKRNNYFKFSQQVLLCKQDIIVGPLRLANAELRIATITDYMKCYKITEIVRVI